MNTYLCRMHQSLSEDEDHGLHCPQPHLHLTMEESLQHWHQEGLRYVATHTTNKERSAVYTCIHTYATVLVYIHLCKLQQVNKYATHVQYLEW